MRRYLLATISSLALISSAIGSASAADLVPEFRSPYYSWAGFYAGVDVGAAWGTKMWIDRTDGDDTGSYPVNGAVAGFHGGWNYQAGPIVVGAEGNFDFTNARGSASMPNSLRALETRTRYLSTLVGRGGIVDGRTLYYLVAGLGIINESHTFQAGAARQTVRFTNSGYVLGAGIEFAVLHNLSAKLEYNYMDFSRRKNINFGAIDNGDPLELDQQIHTLKLGLSYHFGEHGIPVRK